MHVRTAEFETSCGNCDTTIRKGETIVLAHGAWVHAECPDPLAPVSRVCPACWTEHAGECL